MSSKRPVWLLDVDGVVNAHRPAWPGRASKGFAVANGQKYEMRWAPALVDEIRRHAESNFVDIRWCTTWVECVDQLERMWGLPELPRAAESIPSGPEGDRLKHGLAAQLVDLGIPLIWADDTAVPSLPAGHPCLQSSAHALLLAPRGEIGLTPKDMADIQQFVTRWTPK